MPPHTKDDPFSGHFLSQGTGSGDRQYSKFHAEIPLQLCLRVASDETFQRSGGSCVFTGSWIESHHGARL